MKTGKTFRLVAYIISGVGGLAVIASHNWTALLWCGTAILWMMNAFRLEDRLYGE